MIDTVPHKERPLHPLTDVFFVNLADLVVKIFQKRHFSAVTEVYPKSFYAFAPF